MPRAFGGSMDNKLFTAGATLYLPVFEPDSLFSVADGHAVQGDGEACITAVETGLADIFRIGRVKNANLTLPRAETPTLYISMGFDEHLDDAATTALRQMIDWMVAESPPSFGDADRLCSLFANLPMTQLVNVSKGVHMVLAKSAGLIRS